MPVSEASSLQVENTCHGRVLHVTRQGTIYVGRSYAIYRSTDDGQTWELAARAPCPLARRPIQLSRMASRALRHEIKAFLELSNATYVATTRLGIFYGRPGDATLKPSLIHDGGGGLPMKPPMCLSAGPDDRVLCGEYWANKGRREVRVYASDDRGRSFDVAHVFEAGCIKHVHNLIYDKQADHYWVLVGDHGEEPGIGRLSADLRSFDWLVKGKQEYRAVCLFDGGDHLIYGTDSEMAPNAVIRMDKATGRTERLAELSGSCIHACQFGNVRALTTSVEPSSVNSTRHATLWLSWDGEQWRQVYQAEKDRWHPTYFQFGSIVLPRGESSREVIPFSGTDTSESERTDRSNTALN